MNNNEVLSTTKDQEIENLKNEIKEMKEDSTLAYWLKSMDNEMFDALTENIEFHDRIDELTDELSQSVKSGGLIPPKHKEQFKDVLEGFKGYIDKIEKSRASQYTYLNELYSCLLSPEK